MALSIVDDEAKRNAVNRASQYDIRRTGVERERQAALKRQRERIGAQMGAQNLSDSGIQSAEERTMRARVGREAAIQRGAIDVEELRAGEARAEAERERGFLGEQAELGREFVKGESAEARQVERERMNQASELARRGLTLQETAIELQRQNMSEADARYYAGLAHETTEAQIGREFVSTQADKQRGYESIERELDLVDEEAGVVRAVRGLNISEQQLANSVQPLDSPDIMADIIRTSKTEIIEGWDPRFNREMFEREGHADLARIFTPLSVRGKNIGLVEAGYHKARRARIEEDEVRMLQAFVAQAAIAIDNARLFAQMNRALEELTKANEEQKRLLETIQALFTPIVPIADDVLILPLVGSVDTRRAGQIMESLLEGIRRYQAETVIIDITGVPVVDTSVVGHFLKAARAAR